MKWTVFFALISSNSFAQFNCGNAFLDIRDSSNYRTVLIGNRCWMQQNLNAKQPLPHRATAGGHPVRCSEPIHAEVAEKPRRDGHDRVIAREEMEAVMRQPHSKPQRNERVRKSGRNLAPVFAESAPAAAQKGGRADEHKWQE